MLSYDTRPIEEQTHGSEELNIKLYGDRVRDIYRARAAGGAEAEGAVGQAAVAGGRGGGAKPRL